MTTPVNPAPGRRRLLLLAALLLLPVLVAYGLYYSGWRPSATANHGELLQPARPVQDVALTLLGGESSRFSHWHGKWTLLTFSTAECLKPCERNLNNIRQIIAAQGKEAHRVRGVLVVTDGKDLDWLRYAIKDYPGMQVIIGPPAAVNLLARQFVLPAGSPLENLNRVYLVDPSGNFMMSYPADADPTGMNKDIKRLLRVSQIG
ncbi:MAG: SCO family protein [Sulfuricaulis sp.]|uniref:SCO family protein n=1 Tax=Sulfuricaulis sp. TaxID=2003553 RepID=UPI0034A2E50E